MGCLGTVEQRYLVNLIKNAAKNGYTRFVEPCAGTFAMSNLAIQNGYKPEQIETSDVSMMSCIRKMMMRWTQKRTHTYDRVGRNPCPFFMNEGEFTNGNRTEYIHRYFV